jgi:hypothetical protein
VGCQRGMRELWTHIVGVDDVTGDTLAQKSAQCEDTVFFLSRLSLTHTQRPVHSYIAPSYPRPHKSSRVSKYPVPPPSSNSRTSFVHSQQHFLIPSIQNSISSHTHQKPPISQYRVKHSKTQTQPPMPRSNFLTIIWHIFHLMQPHTLSSLVFCVSKSVLHLPTLKNPSVDQGLWSMKKLSKEKT